MRSFDEQLKHSRAVEAAIWGMPIVAADAIRQGFLGLGAKNNDIAFFSRPPDWQFQTTTPNASTHYIWRQMVPPARSAERPGQAVLVSDGVRLGHRGFHPRSAGRQP